MNRVDKEERMQRIRIGLTGLAFVFLLVLLVTAISRSSDDANAPPIQNELAVPNEPNEPLAEIGAAPGTGTSTNGVDGQSNSSKGQ
jgi:hypothetical protein